MCIRDSCAEYSAGYCLDSLLCVARFSTDGVLGAAPRCHSPSGSFELLGSTNPVRIARDATGLGILSFGEDYSLLFQRTDLGGAPVGDPIVLAGLGEPIPEMVGGISMLWDGGGYAALSSRSVTDGVGPYIYELVLRRFLPGG